MTIKMKKMKKKLILTENLCHLQSKSEISSTRSHHTDTKRSKYKKLKRSRASHKLKVQKAMIAFQTDNVLILSAKRTMSSVQFAWTG